MTRGTDCESTVRVCTDDVWGILCHSPRKPLLADPLVLGTAQPVSPSRPRQQRLHCTQGPLPEERQDSKHLNPDNAPEGHVVFVTCRFDSLTELYEVVGSGLLTSLELANQNVRKIVKDCGGYELRAEGNMWVMAFHTMNDALRCALAALRLTAGNGCGRQPEIPCCPATRWAHDHFIVPGRGK